MANPNTRGGAIGRRSLVGKAGSVAKKQIAYKAPVGGGSLAEAAIYLQDVGPATAKSFTFTAPVDGTYKIYAWGSGGPAGGSGGGGGGGYLEKTVTLKKNQQITGTVGPGLQGTQVDTVVNFPDGTTATAQKGQDGSAGPGSGGNGIGGDVNLQGGTGGPAPNGAGATAGQGTNSGPGGNQSTTGTGPAGGGAAGSHPTIRGGWGALYTNTSAPAGFPGGGGGVGGSSVTLTPGGGLVIIEQIKS